MLRLSILSSGSKCLVAMYAHTHPCTHPRTHSQSFFAIYHYSLMSVKKESCNKFYNYHVCQPGIIILLYLSNSLSQPYMYTIHTHTHTHKHIYSKDFFFWFIIMYYYFQELLTNRNCILTLNLFLPVAIPCISQDASLK